VTARTYPVRRQPMRYILIPIVAVTLFTACSKKAESSSGTSPVPTISNAVRTAYDVSFRSSAGEVLATGSITFTSPLPGRGAARGAYQFRLRQVSKKTKEAEWFYRLMPKNGKGEVEWTTQGDTHPDWFNTLDFMPGVADANITARTPAFKDGKTTGTWSYAIFSGGFEGGVIVLERK
jgi:hypothetical protein